jgi:hypothetical protein
MTAGEPEHDEPAVEDVPDGGGVEDTVAGPREGDPAEATRFGGRSSDE